MVATISPFEQGTTDHHRSAPTPSRRWRSTAPAAPTSRGPRAATRRRTPSPATGDGRVVLSTSINGHTWSAPSAGRQPGDTRPSDHARAHVRAGQAATGLLRPSRGLSQLFGQFVDESADSRRPLAPRIRHTIDVWAAQADPGATPVVHRRSASRSTARVASRARRRFSSSNSTRRTCRSSAPAARRSWATTSTSRPSARLFATGRPGASIRRRRPVRCSTASGRTIATSARRSTGSGPTTRRPIPRSRGRP